MAAAEAIRLARPLRRALPDDGEVAGLLDLMLLTAARRPARTTPAIAAVHGERGIPTGPRASRSTTCCSP